MTTKEAAKRWRMSAQRVRVLLAAGRVPGAWLIGSGTRATWMLPDDARKPTQRSKRGRPRNDAT